MIDFKQRDERRGLIKGEIERQIKLRADECGPVGDMHGFMAGYLLAIIAYMAMDIPGVMERLEEDGLVSAAERPIDYEREAS